MSYFDVLEWLELSSDDLRPDVFEAFTTYDRWFSNFDIGEPLAPSDREVRKLKSSGYIGLYHRA